jgi:hypothetical protein
MHGQHDDRRWVHITQAGCSSASEAHEGGKRLRLMKFTITMKDPDYSTQGLERSLCKSTAELSKATALRDSFLEFGEYVTIEFDSETRTARVIPCAELKG